MANKTKRKIAHPKLPMQRQLNLQHEGKYFDLRANFDRLNERYFRGKLYRWHMAAYELLIDRLGHEGDQPPIRRPSDRIYSIFSRRTHGHVPHRWRFKAARGRKLH